MLAPVHIKKYTYNIKIRESDSMNMNGESALNGPIAIKERKIRECDV